MGTPEHLKINGRLASNPISPTVTLRRTILGTDVGYDQAGSPYLFEDQIDYPGSDGCSVNRGDFASVADCVSLADNEACGVVAVQTDSVRGLTLVVEKPDSRGNSAPVTFALDAKHVPEVGRQGTPENYAHSLIITNEGAQEVNYKALRKEDKNWKRKVGEHFRSKLAVSFTVERLPKHGNAA